MASGVKVAIYRGDPEGRSDWSSVEFQEAACRAVAQRAGCEVVATYTGDERGVQHDVADEVYCWCHAGHLLGDSDAEVVILETFGLFVDQNPYAAMLIVDSAVNGITWFSLKEGLIPVHDAYDLMIATLGVSADDPAQLQPEAWKARRDMANSNRAQEVWVPDRRDEIIEALRAAREACGWVEP